jgi:pimeloyl-ACP methyl ester carboxylesterase
VQTAVANGLSFAYLSEGSGPLVLLLHGFPDTAHSWDRVMPAVAKAGFRAVAPFMRGYLGGLIGRNCYAALFGAWIGHIA